MHEDGEPCEVKVIKRIGAVLKDSKPKADFKPKAQKQKINFDLF